jgi:hypothetical protein
MRKYNNFMCKIKRHGQLKLKNVNLSAKAILVLNLTNCSQN